MLVFDKNFIFIVKEKIMKTRFIVFVALLLMLFSFSVQAKNPELVFDLNESTHEMSPILYGLFFEDINYAADGGLYAELVYNRSFEFREPMYNWLKVGKGNAVISNVKPLNENNPQYVTLSVKGVDDTVGLSNTGFGGIVLEKGDKYKFSVYLRGHDSFEGHVLVTLQSANGEVLGSAKISKLSGDWKKYKATIKAKKDAKNAKIAVVVNGKGSIDVDMVSLFPAKTWKNQENGMRRDIVEKLAEMKPSFMRFPGGCIVEGKGLANAYRWKDTIGDVAERKINWNRWDDWKESGMYYQSYGLGFYEYFRLCDDIGAEPVPIINCGLGCQFQGGEPVPMDELGPWVQDALDLIEYANGPADSEWGSKRVKAGHKKPFNLKYLGVGNEQWGQIYFDRYIKFYDAIKAKYPDIVIVTTSGPSPDDNNFKFAWDKFKTVPAEIVDEHYYRSPSWFFENNKRYDSYDRNGPKVFAGEYAAHNTDRANDLYAALSEASFLTGIERNSDIVLMAAYAPLFAKVGSTQWAPDLIWFDNSDVYGSPSYYVQKLFNLYKGTSYVPSALDTTKVEITPRGRVGLGSWVTGVEFKDVKVTQGSKVLFELEDMSDITSISGDWSVENGVVTQSDARAEGTLCYAGDYSWSDYTMSLKARKISGNEGFIIPFRCNETGVALQWNLGGWGNALHGIQSVETLASNSIVTEVKGSIETGRWYDIEIQIKGTRVICKLDGKVIHDVDIPVPSKESLFASVTMDEKKGYAYIKVINASTSPVTIDMNVAGMEKYSSKAKAIVLTSDKVTDTNTIENPENVSTKDTLVDVSSGVTFEPNSLTVIKLKKKGFLFF